MSAVWDKLKEGLLLVVLAVAALLLGIGALLYLPVDYIRYKSSRYYRDLKIKYIGFSGNTTVVRLYDAIQKAGLPLSYYSYTPPPEEDGDENTTYHWFVYKDVLIPAEIMVNLDYWEEERGWFCGDPEQNFGVTEFLQGEAELFARVHPEITCTRLAVLVKRKEVVADLLSRAEQDPALIVYEKGQLVAALQNFIENI